VKGEGRKNLLRSEEELVACRWFPSERALLDP
jgi:hypothetical protein